MTHLRRVYSRRAVLGLFGFPLRLRLGLVLIVLGIGGLSGRYVTDRDDLNTALFSWLVIIVGVAMSLWSILDWDKAPGERPEQKWEKTADNARSLAAHQQWDAALAEFSTAMSQAGPTARRLRAAEEIGTYLADHKGFVEAEPYLRQALAIREGTLGRGNPETMSARERLGDMYLKAGDVAAAARLRKEQLDLMAPRGEINGLDAAYAAAKLGEAQLLGDQAAAVWARDKASAAIETAPPGDPKLPRVLIAQARLSSGLGDHAAAEAALLRVVQIAETGGSNELLESARSNLLDVYMAAGRYADAVPLSEKTLSSLRSRSSLEPVAMARAIREHARILELAGRTEDGAKQRRVADTLERIGKS